MPGHPVDKEEDVTTFLLHDRLECIDERGREKPRTLRQREQAKSEEAVDTLAVAGDHEGPLRIARPEVFRLRRRADAVGLDKIGQHLLVPSFFNAVELDRPLKQRIGDGLSVAQDAQARLALGLHRNVPDRQTDQSAARVGLERWPIYNRRLVGIVGVEQHAADSGFVRLAAGDNRPWAGARPPRGVTVSRRNRRVIEHELPLSCTNCHRREAPRTELPITVASPAQFRATVDLPKRLPYIAASARQTCPYSEPVP